MSFISPRFSVVIPLYNKGKYIATTLVSVLQQSLKDFEVIVVDDGSTDNGLQVVQSFSDPRIRVVVQKNEGVSGARNKGIGLAISENIAFLDADDLWEPTYLEEMQHLLQKYPGAGFYVMAYQTAEKKKVYSQANGLGEGYVQNFFKAEIEHNITRLSATVVPKKICEQAGGFPLGMVSGEDSYFCGKIAIHHPVIFMPKVLVTYNQQFSGLKDRHFKGDTCSEQWFDLLQTGDFYRNEFIANKVIKAGIRSALALHRDISKKIELKASYTRLFKRKWKYLYFLNRMPASAIFLYKKLKPFLSF